MDGVFFLLDSLRTLWQTNRDEIENVQDWQQRKGEWGGDDLEKDVGAETEQGG